MRTLEVLLKRANRQLEDLSGHANKALVEKNRVQTARATCEAATLTEAALIDGSPLSGLGYAAFLDKQKARLAELDVEQKEADARHQEAKSALMAAYAEVKKLESLLSRKREEERQRRDKAEQDAFDERASQIYGR